MIIPINNKYRLRGHELSWDVQKKSRLKNKETGEWEVSWTSILYYGTLEGAVNGLAHRMIRTAEAETIDEAVKAVENVCNTLSVALTPTFRTRLEPVLRVIQNEDIK